MQIYHRSQDTHNLALVADWEKLFGDHHSRSKHILVNRRDVGRRGEILVQQPNNLGVGATSLFIYILAVAAINTDRSLKGANPYFLDILHDLGIIKCLHRGKEIRDVDECAHLGTRYENKA